MIQDRSFLRIEEKLLAFSKIPCRVSLHENKSIYLRIQKSRGILYLHLHRLFLEAPTPVWEAIVRFANKKDPAALRVIRQMANLYFSAHRTVPAKLSERGVAYDLRPIYEKLQKRYFESTYDAAIGWSNRKPKGKGRCITFGSYDRYAHQIRINPLLDDLQVPLFFLEFIVYHEMLHAVCTPLFDKRGRVWVHTKEFKEKERQFPDFEAAKAWERQSLSFFRKKDLLRN